MTARAVGLLLWLLMGGLAASAVFWQLKHPPRPPVASVAMGAHPPELPALTPAKPFRLPPPARYAGITARPVFIAARQPEPPPPPDESAVEKPPSGPETPLPMLMGIMITPEAKVALLRPEEPNAKTARVKVGDMVGEWRMEAIFPNRVLLQNGGAKRDLALERTKKKLAGPRSDKQSGSKPSSSPSPSNALPQPVPPPLAAPAPPQQ